MPGGLCSLVALAAFAAMPLVAQLPAGEIKGRVRVTTALTKKRVSVPQIYERHAAVAPVPVSRPSLAEELRRVVVFLDTPSLPSRPRNAVMDQRQRRFEPEILAVPAGSTVTFPNSDPIFHNVFSLSKARTFDLGNYDQGESRTLTFPHAGMVQLHCHLHPNMSGAILVTPNSWLAQPDPEGGFLLPPVPPGKYTVVAWHRSAGFFRRQVDVRASQSVALDFEIPLLEQARLAGAAK